jgi:single-strand DNA-binding protein
LWRHRNSESLDRGLTSRRFGSREQAEFHDIVLWRQLADFAAGYMTTGRLVYIEGRLQGRTWEATDGTQRRSVAVVADRYQALSSKAAKSAA